MFTRIHLRHNFLLPVLIVAAAVLVSGFLIIQAQAQTTGNASLSFKRDPGTGYFILTIRDPQGIQEFSVKAPEKSSYGGGLGGCPTSRVIDNIGAFNEADFAAGTTGLVVDCQGNEEKFEFSPLKNNVTAGKRVVEKVEEEAPAPAPAPAPAAEEKPAPAPAKVEITYPVAELGNCKNESECKTYCDRPANLEKCVAFAESHNLITAAEAAQAKQFKKVLDSGNTPGNCDSKVSCEAYCGDVTNIDACLAFGEESGFLSGKDLEEAKKIRAAVKGGAKLPGDCRNKTACEAYCKNPQHGEECLAFARQSGFLSDEELREAEKFLPLMQRGETPGACKSKEECEAYCESGDNLDECFEFARKHDLVSDEDAKRFEQFKKAGGVGPGGCKGKSCKSYCEKPENQKACFEWAKENGFLEEKDLRRMEEGRQQLRGALDQAPPEAKACIEESIPGGLAGLESGDFFGGPEIGEKIRKCFESAFSQFGGPGGGFPGGPGGPGGFSGPGGCKSPEECQAYCESNPEACKDFQPPTGGPGGGFPGGGGFGGPGGCKSIDECMAYCQEHPEECGGMGPPGGGPPGEFPGGGATGGQFPGGPGGFPGGPGSAFPGPGRIPSGEKFVGPGGCATPEECIRYCQEEGHKAECDAFKTPATTPYAGGSGPGGCGSVEECNAYCKTHGAECDAFISEKTPSEVRCQSGFETKKDNRGNKYCSPTSCPEGQEFITDVFGRRACSPIGASRTEELRQRIGESPIEKLREGFQLPSGGAPGSFPSGQPPSSEELQKIQEQYQQQYQQQYQNLQPPTDIQSLPPPSYPVPSYPVAPLKSPISQGPKISKPIFLLSRLVTVLLGGN